MKDIKPADTIGFVNTRQDKYKVNHTEAKHTQVKIMIQKNLEADREGKDVIHTDNNDKND